MAFISCSGCLRQVSDRAVACPQCGCPIAATPSDSRSIVATPGGSTLDEGAETMLRTYAGGGEAAGDAQVLSSQGWTVKTITGTEGHTNLGRTFTGAVLTGGISLLLGGSRTKGTITVVYERTVSAVVMANQREQHERNDEAYYVKVA
jgi:hypothetical protein